MATISAVFAGLRFAHTAVSRSVIDVNRDPSGHSLYPGQATTELCPTTTFDGELLWRQGEAPDAAEIVRRRETWFAPYHAALDGELRRLRARHPKVALYDAHSIRSVVPRLFEGELPNFNLGDNSGVSCDLALTRAIADAVDVPVIASGGAGTATHLVEVFRQGRAEAALVAGVLHDGTTSLRELKSCLGHAGFEVRGAPG